MTIKDRNPNIWKGRMSHICNWVQQGCKIWIKR